MPRFQEQNSESRVVTGSGFGYSAQKIETLGATEFTIVTVVTDISSSISSFADEMNKGVASVVDSCKHSPRSDNLLLRVLHFNNHVDEIHGFKSLPDCNPDDYLTGGKYELRPGGSTALYDAVVNAVLATSDYAKNLADNDFLTNGIIVVITDGDDNNSANGTDAVKKAIAKIKREESLESIVIILIGVNVSDSYMAKRLSDFQTNSEINQYVNLDKADSKTIAKLAQFISKSISSQSQSLGTGSQSIPLQI